MNSLNKTEDSGNNFQENKPQNKPTSDLIQSFKSFFKKAENTSHKNIEKSDDSSKDKEFSKKKINETKPQIDKKEFQFSNKKADINQLFSELGTSITDQIEQLFIVVINNVEKAYQTPEVIQQFQIKFSEKLYPIEIKIINSNNQSKLNISCDKELCQLLSKYLPELKQHLRKKSLNFDDIIIEEEDIEEKKPKNKK